MAIGLGTALILTGINFGISWLQRTSGYAREAEDKIREYNEVVRQQHEKAGLFQTDVSMVYGADFYKTLTAGGSQQDLISNIGKDTALGRGLQLDADKARWVVGEGERRNVETYQLSKMASQGRLTEALAMRIEAQQASGEAASAQATSGIRSDRGTGANLVKIQKQQSSLAQRNFEQQLALENRQVISKMQDTKVSASMTATELRKQRDIDAQKAIEQALSGYASFISDMKDYDVSQKNIQEEVKRLKNASVFYKGTVKGSYDADIIDASQFKFIDD